MANRVAWVDGGQYGPSSSPLTVTMAVSANLASRNNPVFLFAVADGGVLSFTSATFTDTTSTVYSDSSVTRDDLIAGPNGDFYTGLIYAPTAHLGGTLTFNFTPAVSNVAGGVLAVALIDADNCEFKITHTYPLGTTNPFSAPTLDQLVSDATGGAATTDPDAQQPIAGVLMLGLAGASGSVTSYPAGWEEIVHRLDSPAGVPQPQVLYAYGATLDINTTAGSWTLDNSGRAMSARGVWLVAREPNNSGFAATRRPTAFAPTRRADQPCQPVMDWSAQGGSKTGSVSIAAQIPSGVDAGTAMLAIVTYWQPAGSGTTMSSVSYAGTHALTRRSQVFSPSATVSAGNGSSVTGALVQEVWALQDATIPTSGALVATASAATEIFVVCTVLQHADTIGTPVTASGQAGTTTTTMAYTAPTLAGGAWLGVFGSGAVRTPGSDFDDTLLGQIWHRLVSSNVGVNSNSYYTTPASTFPIIGSANGWLGHDAGTAPTSPLSIRSALWTISLLPVTGRTPGYMTSWRAWSGTGLPLGGSQQFFAELGVAPNDNLANYSSVTPQWFGEWDDIALDSSGNGDTALFLKNGNVYFQGNDRGGGTGTGIQGDTTANPDNSIIAQVGGGTFQPVRVPGLPATIVKVCCTWDTYWALATNGDLYAWGLVGSGSSGGQLGTIFATSVQCTTPFLTMSGVEDIAPRMVLKRDGTIWTCGFNNQGQLGIGSTDSSSHAWTQVTSFTGTPRRVVVHNMRHYIIMDDRRLWVWGPRAVDFGISNATTPVTSPYDLCFYADDVLFGQQTVILKDGYVYRSKSPIALIGFTNISGLPSIIGISGVGTSNSGSNLASTIAQDNTGVIWYVGRDSSSLGSQLANGYETYDQYGGQIGPNVAGYIAAPVMLGGTYQQASLIHPTGFNYAWLHGGPQMNLMVGYARVPSTQSYTALPCPVSRPASFGQVLG